MRVLIVYESLFGNTRALAEAIKDGIRGVDPHTGVLCVRVGQATADLVEHADVIIVGGPTHMHGMTTKLSRAIGVLIGDRKVDHRVAEGGARQPGVRDWLRRLAKPEAGTRAAAAFDTRIDSNRAGAADAIARRLHRHGYTVVAEPEGFLLADAQGPLLTGELSRARAWGSDLCREPAEVTV